MQPFLKQCADLLSHADKDITVIIKKTVEKENFTDLIRTNETY